MPRGNISVRYRLTWGVPFSKDAFEEWTTHGELDVEVDDESSHLVLGPALPQEAGERVVQLDLFCSHGEDELDVIFTSFEKPNVPPPEDVVKRDARIGGRAGLRGVLEKLTQENDKVGYYVIDINFAESDGWSCKVLPRDVLNEVIFSDLATSTRTEQIGYRFVDGISGLQELSFIYYHDLKEFSAKATAKGPVAISSDLQSHVVTDLVKLITARFFVLVESEEVLP